jgi:hypothetical protein
MSSGFVVKDKFSASESLAIFVPPSWTRLEPVSATGDPRPGLESRVHDPVWLLARQWQLGEFAGEDAGTPLTVRVVTNTSKIDRWADASGTVRPVDHENLELLEPSVEREPVRPADRGPGMRTRIETAAALMAWLDDESLGGWRPAFAENCAVRFDEPLAHPGGEHAALDPEWLRMKRLFGAARLPDAERIAHALEASAPALPGWLDFVDDDEHDKLADLLATWLEQYRRETSPLAGGADSWVDSRLEYSFSVGVGAQSFHASSHRGAEIEWHSFDPAVKPLEFEADEPPAPPVERRVHALLATPLRYPGMPADRLWEMEDAQVNLGLVESEPWDLARLLVAEFALTFGNDWLVVPIDVSYGSLTTVESVLYTTAFGERFVAKPTAEVSPDGHWQMFTNAVAGGVASKGILLPPGAVAVQDGPPIEDVLFLRDEMANLCWAVERRVQGPSGFARDRARERDNPVEMGAGPVVTAQLDYLLQTGVPARWIPYLPRSSGYRAVELAQGAMPDANGAPIRALGRLLNSETIRRLADAEIPREGINVLRQPSVTRRADGSYLRWIARRISVGRGEGASQLAFDSAISRRPRPR